MPQRGQAASSRLPHFLQKFASSRLGVLHFGQLIGYRSLLFFDTKILRSARNDASQGLGLTLQVL
ncbi:MAG TPA: hypothetical protein VI410_03035, partial [Anaerolineales bacterium]|nr:hypothetical protein [Anaerolineales bacterium]